PGDGRKGSAQSFVTFDNFVEALRQNGHIEGAYQSRRIRHIRKGCTREKLVNAPEVFLGHGQWHRTLPWQELQSSHMRALRCLTDSLNLAGQAPYRWCIKQHPQWYVDLECLAEAGHHLHSEQGVPAQSEKIVVDANRFDAKDMRPYAG